MILTDEFLADLEAKADAATPGPRRVEYDQCDCQPPCNCKEWPWAIHGFANLSWRASEHRDWDNKVSEIGEMIPEDAEFVAACDPTTIKALVAEVRKMRFAAIQPPSWDKVMLLEERDRLQRRLAELEAEAVESERVARESVFTFAEQAKRIAELESEIVNLQNKFRSSQALANCMNATVAVGSAKEAGAAEERARIVAWLRGLPEHMSRSYEEVAIFAFLDSASKIEDGEHLAETPERSEE